MTGSGDSRSRDDFLAQSSAGDLSRSPAVIVGAVRSGTTLLHLMLGGHPSIRLFGEFEESVKWLGDEGWIGPERYRSLLGIDRVASRRNYQLPVGLDTPEIVQVMYRHNLGDLAPGVRPGFVIHSRIDRVADLWPDARVIHLVRDPRDVSASCIRMGWAGHVWYSSRIWTEAEHRFDRLASRIPRDQIIDLRYEDLIDDPRRHLGRILKFLGLEWNDGVLSYPEQSTYSLPDKSLVSQWRRNLSKREIGLVEVRCGGLLVDRGYQSYVPRPRHPGLLERICLWLGHRIRRWRFSSSRYGFLLGAIRPFAKYLGPDSSLKKWAQARVNQIDERHLK